MQTDKSHELLMFFLKMESEKIEKCPFYKLIMQSGDNTEYGHYLAYAAEIEHTSGLDLSQATIRKYCEKFNEIGIFNSITELNYKNRPEVTLYHLNLNITTIPVILRILVKNEIAMPWPVFHHIMSIYFRKIVIADISCPIELLSYIPGEAPLVYEKIKDIGEMVDHVTFTEYLNRQIQTFLDNNIPYNQWKFLYPTNNSEEFFSIFCNGINPFIQHIKYNNIYFSKEKDRSFFEFIPYFSCLDEISSIFEEFFFTPLINLLYITPNSLLLLYDKPDREQNIQIINREENKIKIESSLLSDILKQSIISFLKNNHHDKDNPINEICFGAYPDFWMKSEKTINQFSIKSENSITINYNLFLHSMEKENIKQQNYPINIDIDYPDIFKSENIRTFELINAFKANDPKLSCIYTRFMHRTQSIIIHIDLSSFDKTILLKELSNMLSIELNRLCFSRTLCEFFIQNDINYEIINYTTEKGEYGKSIRKWWKMLIDYNTKQIKRRIIDYLY